MIEKSRDLGKDVRDSGRAVHPFARNKGKEPIIPDDVDTPADDELSLGSSRYLSLSPAKEGAQRLNRVRGLRITLPSVMPLVAHPVGQG